MRKASTVLLEQGTQTPSPAPDLIPAERLTENLHRNWYSKRGHFRPSKRNSQKSAQRLSLTLLLHVGEVMLECRIVMFDRDGAIRHCAPPGEAGMCW